MEWGMVDRKESEHHHRESDILLQTFKEKRLESIEIYVFECSFTSRNWKTQMKTLPHYKYS